MKWDVLQVSDGEEGEKTELLAPQQLQGACHRQKEEERWIKVSFQPKPAPEKGLRGAGGGVKKEDCQEPLVRN